MSNELHVLPARPVPLDLDAWCAEARRLMASLSLPAPELVADPSTPGPRLEPGESVTFRMPGTSTGGVHASAQPSYFNHEPEDDPAAKFLRDHDCPWEIYLSTLPRSPEHFAILTTVLAIAATRLLEGVIVNACHGHIPLDVATAQEWEDHLRSRLARSESRPTDLEFLGPWYRNLSEK
jgi:hypothetical protein